MTIRLRLAALAVLTVGLHCANAVAPRISEQFELPGDGTIPWERVPGCARTVSAGLAGQIFVSGCEPAASAARELFRWVEPAGAPGRFDRMPGQASQVAVGGPGWQSLWATGPGGRVYASVGELSGSRGAAAPVAWTAVDFSATWLAASLDEVWAVTPRPHPSPYGNVAAVGRVQCGTVSRGAAPCRVAGWTELPFAVMQVAVGDEPWVIDTRGAILRRRAGQWGSVPGCADAIAARGRHVWMLRCASASPGEAQPGGQAVMRWTGHDWSATGGYGMAIAVDAIGNPWVVDAQGGIWRQRRYAPPAVPR